MAYLGIAGIAFAAGLISRPTVATAPTEPSRDPQESAALAEAGATLERVGRSSRRSVMPMPGARMRDAERAIDDPIALSNLGVTAREIFEGQERDPTWAPAAETFLTEKLAEYVAAMIPYATQTAAECRASACQIRFEAPADKLDEGFSLIQSFPLGNVRLAPQMDRGSASIVVTILYRPDVRPVEDMPRHYSEQMARFFPDGYARARAWVDENGAHGDKKQEEAQ